HAGALRPRRPAGTAARAGGRLGRVALDAFDAGALQYRAGVRGVPQRGAGGTGAGSPGDAAAPGGLARGGLAQHVSARAPHRHALDDRGARPHLRTIGMDSMMDESACGIRSTDSSGTLLGQDLAISHPPAPDAPRCVLCPEEAAGAAEVRSNRLPVVFLVGPTA